MRETEPREGGREREEGREREREGGREREVKGGEREDYVCVYVCVPACMHVT